MLAENSHRLYEDINIQSRQLPSTHSHEKIDSFFDTLSISNPKKLTTNVVENDVTKPTVNFVLLFAETSNNKQKHN